MVSRLVRSAGTRLRIVAWRVVIAALVSAAAWWIAQRLLNQPAPIFAPIAAMVSLLDEPGTRGHRAFRMLGGVLVGVAVGEVLVRYLGNQPWAVGIAMATASLLVTLVSINPLIMIQAGVAALLVVGVHLPQSGLSRLWGALIGGALALAVSQVLWSPSPLLILSAAVRTALAPVAHTLHGCARALADLDADAAAEGLETARTSYRELSAWESARLSSRAIATRTVRGRKQRPRLARFAARTTRIDRLHTGALLVARTTEVSIRQELNAPPDLVRAVAELARAVDILAMDPTSEWRRRRARELTEDAERLPAHPGPPPVETLSSEVRQLALELRIVAGS